MKVNKLLQIFLSGTPTALLPMASRAILFFMALIVSRTYIWSREVILNGNQGREDLGGLYWFD